MPQTIVAGNWKMNLTPSQGVNLINEIAATISGTNVQVVFCAPFTHLHAASEAIKASGKTNFYLGAQNCYYQASGAYTGEISISMLQELDVSFVIIGHSERRQYFNETNELLKLKVDALIQNNITPIFCCGEPLNVREAGTQNAFVENQLLESVMHLDASQIAKIVIAYEPIWAIGTGVTASAQQAQDMHLHLRTLLANKYSQEVADNISILYGGSCNAANAKELLALADVNGGLIGGAALKAADFCAIIEAGN